MRDDKQMKMKLNRDEFTNEALVEFTMSNDEMVLTRYQVTLFDDDIRKASNILSNKDSLKELVTEFVMTDDMNQGEINEMKENVNLFCSSMMVENFRYITGNQNGMELNDAVIAEFTRALTASFPDSNTFVLTEKIELQIERETANIQRSREDLLTFKTLSTLQDFLQDLEDANFDQDLEADLNNLITISKGIATYNIKNIEMPVVIKKVSLNVLETLKKTCSKELVSELEDMIENVELSEEASEKEIEGSLKENLNLLKMLEVLSTEQDNSKLQEIVEEYKNPNQSRNSRTKTTTK